jgi:uncharacterized surface protein with fasciclin (FAS1) repeats
VQFYQKFLGLTAGAMLLCSVQASAASSMSMMNPEVGGHAMYSSRTIVANAVNSNDNTILVAAVKAAGLVEVLNSKGPFTVFAPTDEAFKMLPAGTVHALVQPENKAKLTSILEYHVVPGVYDFRTLAAGIHHSGGTLELKTVEGDILTAKFNGPRNIVLIDAKGNVAQISTYDVYQSNGVINVIDKVLMP